MGKKKSSSFNVLFFLGMLVALVGFCLPMFTGVFGSTANGFKFINFERSSFVTIGALLLFIGACCGSVVGLLDLLKIKVSSKKLIALLAIVVVAVGAVIIIIGFTTNGGVYKAIGKSLFKHATYGFYMVIAGWIVSVLGSVM